MRIKCFDRKIWSSSAETARNLTLIVLFRILSCPFFPLLPDILIRVYAGYKFPITVIGDEKRPDARCRMYARSSVVHFSIFEKSLRRHLRDAHDILLTRRVSRFFP